MGDFIGKLKEVKGIKIIILGLAVGLLLLLIGSFNMNTAKVKTEEKPTQDSHSDLLLKDYGRELEERLELLIGTIDGVGAVRVMVAFESGSEFIYAKDIKGSASDEHVIIGSSVDASPVIVKEITPKISGVAVVCRGVTASVKAEIIELVRTLFSLPSSRVYVVS